MEIIENSESKAVHCGHYIPPTYVAEDTEISLVFRSKSRLRLKYMKASDYTNSKHKSLFNLEILLFDDKKDGTF